METNKLKAPAYSGLAKQTSEITLEKIVEMIRCGTCKSQIDRINYLSSIGEKEKAANSKKQLPFYTLTANYHERRLAPNIIRYNDVITIDLDYVPREMMSRVKAVLIDCPFTICCFVSPSGKGFKAFMRLDNSAARRYRNELYALNEVTFSYLEMYHQRMYDLTKNFVERITGVAVDASGKDIGRGFFLSYDADVFLNTKLLSKIEPYGGKILLPDNLVQKKRGPKPQFSMDNTVRTDVPHETRLLFKKALDTTRKKYKFEEGSRDTFLHALGLACYKQKMTEEMALLLTKERFGQCDVDIVTPIRNGFYYTSKTDAAEGDKTKKKKSTGQKLNDFLKENYIFRINAVTKQVEYIMQTGNEEYDDKQQFCAMEDIHYNTLAKDAELEGISTNVQRIRMFVNTLYTTPYDPFVSYFTSLPKWDGRDYITELAQTIQTMDQKFWIDSLKRWLVAMVACGTLDHVINHQMLILFSQGQGIGKSTWISGLIPKELKRYYRSGGINLKKTDHLLLPSAYLLMNIDEFDGMRRDELAAFKDYLTQPHAIERKAYDHDTKCYGRRASFIGGTNIKHFLKDSEGNRRFLISTVLSIDNTVDKNLEGVYSQVMYLLESGFKYWYDGDEINLINERNEIYRSHEPIAELFRVHIRRGTMVDLNMKWLTATKIAQRLSQHTRQYLSANQTNIIKQILENENFLTRAGLSGLIEYGVIEMDAEALLQEEKYRPNLF